MFTCGEIPLREIRSEIINTPLAISGKNSIVFNSKYLIMPMNPVK